MESSVKTISRPVIDRLPVDVNQLDEFACRQLDRVRYRPCPIFSGTDELDLSQFGRYRRPSDPERMLIDGRDQSRERGGPELAEHGSWSSGLQMRDASAPRPHSRNGKDRENPPWREGGTQELPIS
jgi:hypothetical protein